jgi:TPR repeat protein
MVEAYKWFRLAADRGHQDASEAMISTRALLSPTQFEEGERRYRGFKAKR